MQLLTLQLHTLFCWAYRTTPLNGWHWHYDCIHFFLNVQDNTVKRMTLALIEHKCLPTAEVCPRQRCVCQGFFICWGPAHVCHQRGCCIHICQGFFAEGSGTAYHATPVARHWSVIDGALGNDKYLESLFSRDSGVLPPSWNKCTSNSKLYP
jgi:hypothetical protein